MEIKTIVIKEKVKNIKETEQLVKNFYDNFLQKEKGALLLLEGNLGSGKTTFTQFIGKSMGIQQIINSPSFVIYNIYKVQNRVLMHYDLYRISSIELEEMELRELWYDLYEDCYTIHSIEWWKNANYIESTLPIYLIQIQNEVEFDSQRKIDIYRIHQTRYE